MHGHPNKKNVLILRSNPVAPDPRVEKIARVLEAAGYRVSILGWDRTAQMKSPDMLGTIPLLRLPVKAPYGAGMANFPALLRWQAALFSWLVRSRKSFDLLHACDFDTVLPALACKLLWGKRVVYDIFDFYADYLRRTPAWIKRIIRGLDFWAINHADGVILVDDARMEQIAGSHPRACVSIYNSPEDEPVAEPPADAVPEPPAEAAAVEEFPEGKEKSALEITYVGLLQAERGIYEMLNVLRHHPQWHLHLAGMGGDEEKIAALVKELPNVSWYGRIPYRRTLQLNRQADVLFATYDPVIPNHRYSSANKLFEGMMLGKPVIVARYTNMDRVVERESCGIVVDYGSESGLEHALSRLAEDHELRNRLGENGRRAYVEIYSWAKMASRLAGFYQMILEKGGK
jgi:glycosyltransferase involved in cell wall biosynthesis